MSTRLNPECYQSFLDLGGYRLLKRWIKIAEDEDSLDELKIILAICKKLPFDGFVVKETEIGKSIKKLLKFRSSNASDKQVASLYSDVKAIMDSWTKAIEEGAKGSSANSSIGGVAKHTSLSVEAGDMLDSINEKLYSDILKKQQQMVAQKGGTTSVSMGTKFAELKLKNPPSTENTASKNQDQIEKIPCKLDLSTPQSRSVMTKTESNKAPMEFNGGKLIAATLPAGHSALIVPDIIPNASIASLAREKKSMEVMADKARKLQAAKLVEQTRMSEVTVVEIPSAEIREEVHFPMHQSVDLMDGYVHGAEYVEEALSLSFSLSDLPPRDLVVKGILKKKKSTVDGTFNQQGDGDNVSNSEMVVVKKKRDHLVWADAEGGELRQIREFEVKGKLKTSTASYKSHRDLVKRERQLEKTTNISKVNIFVHDHHPMFTYHEKTISASFS